MTPQEMAQFQKDYGVVSNRKEKQIVSRRYNLIVRKGDEVVDRNEYLTMRQARELKAEYNADGFACDIIEDVTIDNNGKEIITRPRKEIPIVKGVGGFGTPEATPHKIENDRAKARQKANRQQRNTKVKEVRYENAYNLPISSLYEMYLAAVEKNGYEVRDRFDGTLLFRGLQNETSEFLFAQTKKGYSLKDFDIKFLG